MREIKFRAWNKRDKVMEYDVNVNQGKPVKQGYQWFDTENIETVYHSSLQQYTGLKDCHGREIYEGDIVKFHFPNPYNTVVKFKNGHFAFYKGKRMMVDPYYYTNHVWSYAEVIGNIYENPELLEKKGHYQSDGSRNDEKRSNTSR